ncbi:hypothetical protein [Nocardioides taihuensis]|uniref:Uncharacterized protein n=1 Tax=Nocardioides taihuensis TaxID=1835606 RepID=A0ABW0BDK0_9ACTN
MTGFSGSPRLTKGALIGLDVLKPLASVIVFQYNPEKVTRTLRARTGGGDGAEGEALRLSGPPEETFDLAIEIDATDQLAVGDSVAGELGIAPQLASLEMMFYPASGLVIANEALALAGLVEVVPPEAPLALLVWGPTRILPVRITSISVAEEAYDPSLNPIQAKVTLGVRVLTYDDLGLLSVGGGLFMVHQVAKEAMANLGSALSFSATTTVGAGATAGG